MTAVIELHYLPCIAYFSTLSGCDEVLLESHEHYVKQTYRNRAYINTEHGKDVLIIPLTGKHGKVAIRDVRIDHGQKWLNHHWRTIESAYRKAPFFEYYADDLRGVLAKKQTFLFDLNYELLTMCLSWLRLPVTLNKTFAYEKKYANEFSDLRDTIVAKGSTNDANEFKGTTYQQVFGNAFVENLSIVDLIFCCGPEAGSKIKSSRRRN